MSDHRPIKVQFPKRMTVDSPETDKRIDSLAQVFKSQSEMLRGSVQKLLETLQVLRELPALVRDFQASVNEQFSNAFTHRMEAEVHSRQASLVAADKRREILEASLEERVARLPEDRGRIVERYGKVLGRVSKETQNRIAKLDKHAFDLLDHVYPKQIQERFSYDSMPTVRFLAAEAESAAAVRAICMEDALSHARVATSQLLDARAESWAALAAETSSQEVEAGAYRIPVLFVEVEDPSGERRVEFVRHPDVPVEAHADLVESLSSSFESEVADAPEARALTNPARDSLAAHLAQLMGEDLDGAAIDLEAVRWQGSPS
ncbi:MAG: hypothetical protein RH859_13230 [Longimicrobiales bacterium]